MTLDDRFEMAADIVVLVVIVAVVAFIGGAAYQKEHEPTKAEVLSNLTHDERQAIAVQFMCAERQWKGVDTFCGSQVFDSSGRVK